MKSNQVVLRSLLMISAALNAATSAGGQGNSASTVITGAQIADGTGAPLRKVSVRIVGDRITRIGSFSRTAGP